MDKKQIKAQVISSYSKIAQQQSSCCEDGCCSSMSATEVASKLGYNDEQLRLIPQSSNLGLSCGNPIAQANLQHGDIVLDLGSGAGFDCFIAAQAVGFEGHVYGVDCTPSMIDLARDNAVTGNYRNVEFLEGDIEHLPLNEESVSVIISNCVLNLVADKMQAVREMFRVLKPEGRICLSDVILTKQLPAKIVKDLNNYSACISGASDLVTWQQMLKASGFSQINISIKQNNQTVLGSWNKAIDVNQYLVSAIIQASK